MANIFTFHCHIIVRKAEGYSCGAKRVGSEPKPKYWAIVEVFDKVKQINLLQYSII